MTSKHRGYLSLRSHRRIVAALSKTLQHARTDNDALQARNNTCERRINELGRLFVTAENYYRTQRIIADLIGGDDAPIAADLKTQIWAALYYGVAPPGFRVSHARDAVIGQSVEDMLPKL